LTSGKFRQKDDASIWKFQRIMMPAWFIFVDLAKDRSLVAIYFSEL
jgi:hypothetical protein